MMYGDETFKEASSWSDAIWKACFHLERVLDFEDDPAVVQELKRLLGLYRKLYALFEDEWRCNSRTYAVIEAMRWEADHVYNKVAFSTVYRWLRKLDKWVDYIDERTARRVCAQWVVAVSSDEDSLDIVEDLTRNSPQQLLNHALHIDAVGVARQLESLANYSTPYSPK